jgi:hypothetical protein
MDMRCRSTSIHEIYDFSGTSYEIGFKRGKMMRELLKNAIENQSFGSSYHRDIWPVPDDYNLDHLKQKYPNKYKKWEEEFEKTPTWFKEEAKGVAEGAGIPFEKMIINSCWFPFNLMGENQKYTSKEQILGDCSGFIAFEKATRDGRVIIGGNDEGINAEKPTNMIVRMKNKNGNSFVMQSHIPWLTDLQIGMNNKGVCIFPIAVSIKLEEFGEVGYGMIKHRLVLQDANNLDEAIDILREAPTMGGQHILLADPKRAVHIEIAGKHFEVIEPESGFSAGSSPYFSSPKMTSYCDVLTDETDPKFSYRKAKKRGVFRMERYHELFEEKKPLRLEDVPSILGDHGGRGTGLITENMEGSCLQGSDYTICVHGKLSSYEWGEAGHKGSFHTNCWSCIHKPDERKMYIAFGNPCEADYIPFKPPK